MIHALCYFAEKRMLLAFKLAQGLRKSKSLFVQEAVVCTILKRRKMKKRDTQMYSQLNNQPDRRAERQTESQTGSKTDWQTERKTVRKKEQIKEQTNISLFFF